MRRGLNWKRIFCSKLNRRTLVFPPLWFKRHPLPAIEYCNKRNWWAMLSRRKFVEKKFWKLKLLLFSDPSSQNIVLSKREKCQKNGGKLKWWSKDFSNWHMLSSRGKPEFPSFFEISDRPSSTFFLFSCTVWKFMI